MPNLPERAKTAGPAQSITEYLRSTAKVQHQHLAFKQMTQGSILMTGGILVSWLAVVFPIGARLLMFMSVLGFLRLLNGIFRSIRLRPFPWKRVLVAVGVPILALTASVLGFLALAAAAELRNERAQAAAALAAADKERANQIRGEAAGPNLVAERDRDARIERATAMLSSRQPRQQCDAALQLARLDAKDQVPALEVLLNHGSFAIARNCAAGALVTLGHVDMAMAAYIDWAAGADSELHSAALRGFGAVGEAAAEPALPYLAEELKSPHAAARYIAVDVLSKLGPSATPLLKMAAGDADKNVRDYATAVLAAR